MEIYAEIPFPKPENTTITQLEPIPYGSNIYYGIKFTPFHMEDTDEKDDMGNVIQKQVEDDGVYYDPISTLYIQNKNLQQVTQNNQNVVMSLMKSAMNQQAVNLQLMKSLTTKGGN